jgi:hypothetical protein
MIAADVCVPVTPIDFHPEGIQLSRTVRQRPVVCQNTPALAAGNNFVRMKA